MYELNKKNIDGPFSPDWKICSKFPFKNFCIILLSSVLVTQNQNTEAL